jgi:hypothetical protein
MEDEYDEEADSDFQEDALIADELASATDSEGQADDLATVQPRKRRKIERAQPALIQELDSGDEATIKQQKKVGRKQQKSVGHDTADDGNESEGWRARTRAIRVKEQDERKRNKLATSNGSTIDVDRIWEEMNRPHAPELRRNEADKITDDDQERSSALDGNKENVPTTDTEEMVTIKRTYKFAGEVHVEKKTVPKSSAEARLWLSQQEATKPTATLDGAQAVQRPLRKFSRFDPNISNLSAFQSSWAGRNAQDANLKGPKLNVVEKSKMDWAAHVDSEGLKEELDTHAKAKEGYLTRMDFLGAVEQRREEEAKAARLKGR